MPRAKMERRRSPDEALAALIGTQTGVDRIKQGGDGRLPGIDDLIFDQMGLAGGPRRRLKGSSPLLRTTANSRTAKPEKA